MIEAYKSKQWNPDPDKFTQCKGLKNVKTFDSRYSKWQYSLEEIVNEGCQIYGSLEVTRVKFY